MAKAKKKTVSKKKVVSIKKKTVKKATTKKAVQKKVNVKLKDKSPIKKVQKKTSVKHTAKKIVKKTVLATKKNKTSAKAAIQNKGPAAKVKSVEMVITPLDDRIFILPIGVSDKTPGGLFIPEVAQDQSNLKGKVLAAGRGHQNVKGHLLKVEVKVGDEVLFSKHSGSKILLNGLELIVVRESDLLGILES